MAQVINTNVSSLFAGAALNKSNVALQTAMQRLSSGVRINSAKDDATGMVTAAGYESTRRGADIAIRNANDGISDAQINEGYHAQVYDNLQRIREIAVQLGGTASGVETTALVAENTRLLGLAANSVAKVTGADGTAASVAGTKATLAGVLDVNGIDSDITAVTTARATYGADMATYQSAINNLQTLSVNTAAAFSRIMDTDFAAETTAMTRNQILQQAGTAMLAQANQIPNNVLTLLR